jgi:NAD-dependent dihydropyrimidine dehydrogenase PreA subunit
MIRINKIKCTGCGNCVDVCPQQAITINNDVAVVNEELCVECGTCVSICPVNAIHEIAPVYTRLRKGGEKMSFGRGWFSWGRGGRGNSYPFCRFYSWLPRRWWAAPRVSFTYPHTGPGAGYPASVAPYYVRHRRRQSF